MAEKTTCEEMDIPDDAMKRIARCLLPAIQAFFDSEEGRREFAQWLEQQKPANEHAA